MRFNKRRLLLFLVLFSALELSLMSLSTLNRLEVYVQRDFLLPSVVRMFKIPRNITVFGWPMFWLSNVEGIQMAGGTSMGYFSYFSVLWKGLLVNFLFYALCSLPILYLVQRKTKQTENETCIT